MLIRKAFPDVTDEQVVVALLARVRTLARPSVALNYCADASSEGVFNNFDLKTVKETSLSTGTTTRPTRGWSNTSEAARLWVTRCLRQRNPRGPMQAFTTPEGERPFGSEQRSHPSGHRGTASADQWLQRPTPSSQAGLHSILPRRGAGLEDTHMGRGIHQGRVQISMCEVGVEPPH